MTVRHMLRLISFALVGAVFTPVQAANLTLVAKCGFPGGDQEIIRPGTPFIYVFEDSGSHELYVINSVANEAERISEPVARLAGKIAPVQAAGDVGGTVTWSQPDLTGASGPSENWLTLGAEPGTLFAASGRTSYTGNAYPLCVIFDK